MMEHEIVSREQWLLARKELLQKEKEFTKQREAFMQTVRDLPWVLIEKEYVFQSLEGEASLSDLFDGKSQLIIYHFMFGPDWDEGCKSCSFWADNFERSVIHLKNRDVSLIAVSRSELEKLELYKKRLGWTFKWASSLNSDFNIDFHISANAGEAMQYNYLDIPAGPEREMPGISVFYKDESGKIYHTYSRFARGLDLFNATYHYLDIVPKGRDEKALPYAHAWVKRWDEY
ncbi:MAG: DUF899 domain-containing protein [Bacteroidetes bacterium]|nr:DUF899 domain-containing protein [Bacteroidota bacterium]